jgi:DNA polymerase I-like protein with 3'-5' exonuclease and polymerase domains
MLFIDIETSSPDPENEDLSLDPRRNKIDLIGVCNDDPGHKGLVIFQPEHCPPEGFLGNELAGHNFKFDYKSLHWKGYKLQVKQYVHDTLVMATALMTKVPDDYIERYEQKRRELNAALPKDNKGHGYRAAKKHSLKVLAPYFLGVSPFWENPATTNDPEYLKLDVQYTKGLYDHFIPMMKKEGVWEFYNDKLMPWQRMTLESELDGIHINIETLHELRAKSEAGVITSHAKLREAWAKVEDEWKRKQMADISAYQEKLTESAVLREAEKYRAKGKTEEEIKEKEQKVRLSYGRKKEVALQKPLEDFNYASASQILWAFKDVLHYPTINMEGEETTGADMLELLVAQGKNDVKPLLEYRENYKLAHSYFPAYQGFIVDGRIHCNFNLHGARTGRLSCDNPNLQQVPPVLKKIFAPGEGNSLVSQDLSAIEPVLIAYYTEDPELCRILMEGHDFHGIAAVAFDLVNCKPHEVKAKYPNERYAAKQGDLSIFYGSGKKRLYTTLTLNGIKHVKGQPLTEQICAKMVYRFRDLFKEAWDFKQMLDAELIAGNPIENLFGRRFKIDNPEDVYMKGFNRLIQGSASDLLLQGTLDCLAELSNKGIWARLRLLVHDNTVLECRDEDAEYVNSRLCYHLTKFKLQTKHGLVPLKVEGGHGKTWKS